MVGVTKAKEINLSVTISSRSYQFYVYCSASAKETHLFHENIVGLATKGVINRIFLFGRKLPIKERLRHPVVYMLIRVHEAQR